MLGNVTNDAGLVVLGFFGLNRRFDRSIGLGQVLRAERVVVLEVQCIYLLSGPGDLGHDLLCLGYIVNEVVNQELVASLIQSGQGNSFGLLFTVCSVGVHMHTGNHITNLQRVVSNCAGDSYTGSFCEVATALDGYLHLLEVAHQIIGGFYGDQNLGIGTPGEQLVADTLLGHGLTVGVQRQGQSDINCLVVIGDRAVNVSGGVADIAAGQLGKGILFSVGQQAVGDVTRTCRFFRSFSFSQILGTERVVVLVAQGFHLGSGPGDPVHSILTLCCIVCIVVYKEGIVALIHSSDVLILGGFHALNSIGCGVATGNDVTDLQLAVGNRTGNAYPVGFCEQAAALDTDVHLLIEAHNVVGSFSAEGEHAVNQVEQLVADAFLGHLVAGHSHSDIRGLVVLRQSAVEHSGGIADIAAGQLGKGILFSIGQLAGGDITRLGRNSNIIHVFRTEGVVVQEVKDFDLSCRHLGLNKGLLGAIPLGINNQELVVALIQSGKGCIGLGAVAIIYVVTGNHITDLQLAFGNRSGDLDLVILCEHAAAVDTDIHSLEVGHCVIGSFCTENKGVAVLHKQLLTSTFVGLVLHIHDDAHGLVVFRQSTVEVLAGVGDIGGSQDGKTGLFSVSQFAGGNITGSGNHGLLCRRLLGSQLLRTQYIAEVPGDSVQILYRQDLGFVTLLTCTIGVIEGHPLTIALVNSAVVQVHISAVLALDDHTATKDITNLGVLDTGALYIAATGTGNQDLVVVGTLGIGGVICAGPGQSLIAVLIHCDINACLLVDPRQNVGQLVGCAVCRPVVEGQVSDGFGFPGSQLVSIDETQSGISGEFGVNRRCIYDLLNGSDTIGTENVVVAPFLTDVLGEDGLGVIRSNIALGTAVFDEQEAVVALVDTNYVSGAGLTIDGGTLSATEQVTNLEHIRSDDKAAIECGATVGFRHQHGAVIVIELIVIAHPQLHLAACPLEDQVSGSIDGLGAQIYRGVHTGLAVCPVGNGCQVEQLLGAVLEVFDGELSQNILFSGGQCAILDVPLNHFVDVLKSSGGTQNQVALVAQILNKAVVGIETVTSIQSLSEGGDLAVEPVVKFGVVLEVELAPDLGLDTGHLQALHVQQEVAVALVNSGHIETGGTAADHYDVAGVQILHGSDLYFGGIVDGGTCVVHQHIVPLFSAVLRLFQLEVVVAKFTEDGSFVFHIAEQILKQRCEGSVVGTVGDDIHTQLAVNFAGEHAVNLDPLKVLDAHFSKLLASNVVQQDQAGIGLVGLTHIGFSQIGSGTHKSGDLGIDVGVSLTGTQAHEQVVHKGGGDAECRINGIQTAFAVQRSVGGVAQIDHNGITGHLTLFVNCAIFFGLGQIQVNEDVTRLQIFFTEFVDTNFTVVFVGVAPHTAVVTGDHHIIVDLILGVGGLGIEAVHMSCDAGAVVVQVCAVGGVVLVLTEEDIHDLLHIGQLQVKAGGGLIDLLGKMGAGIYVGADLVAIVAVPGISAGFKEAGHITLDLVGKLLAANTVFDGVGGNVVDPATGADDGVAHIAGNSYSVSKGAGFAGRNVSVPAQGVAVNDGAKDRLQFGALGDMFYHPQVLVIHAFIVGDAAPFQVGQVIHIVTVVCNSNAVCKGVALGGGAVGGDGNGSVDGHAHVFQTGIGDIIKTVVGGLNGVGLVVGELILQKTGPQLVVGIDLIVAGILITIVDGQKIQRTANNDGVFTPTKGPHIEVLVVGIEEVVFHGGELYGTGGFSLVSTGIHGVLAAAGIQNDAVTYIQNGVAGIVEDNDVAGTHVFFPILEEVICTLGRVPVVVLNIVGGVIVVILNTLALGVPAQDGHIIRIAGVTPQGHSQTVELAAQNGVAQSCHIGVISKATTNSEHTGVGGGVFHYRESSQTALTTGVTTQRGTQVLLHGVQGSGVILIGTTLEVPGESHFCNGLFHICTGQRGVVGIGILIVPSDGSADHNGLALNGNFFGYGEGVAGIGCSFLTFGGVDHGSQGEYQNADQKQQAQVLALLQLTGGDQEDQNAGNDHCHGNQCHRQDPRGKTALATLVTALIAAGGIGIGRILHDDGGVHMGKLDLVLQ